MSSKYTAEYKALADFSALARNARLAKKELKDVRQEVAKTNAIYAAQQRQVDASAVATAGTQKKLASSVGEVGDAADKATPSMARMAQAQERTRKAVDSSDSAISKSVGNWRRYGEAQAKAARSADLIRDRVGGARIELAKSERAIMAYDQRSRKFTDSTLFAARAFDQIGDSGRAAVRSIDTVGDALKTSGGDADKGGGAFSRLADGFRKAAKGGGAFGSVLSLLKFPAIIALVGQLSNAIYGLVGGLGALTGALGPAIGGLAALPGLLIAAISGVGVAIASFKGLGDVVKAYDKQQEAVGKNEVDRAQKTADAARARQDAAESITDAERTLQRARSDQVRSREDNTRALVDAQRSIQDARQEVVDADKEGSAEIAEARRSIIDAQRAVVEAEREGAEQIADARRGIVDAQREIVAAEREGAQQIADARRGIADAQRDLVDAQRGVAEAEGDLSEARQQARKDLEDQRQQVQKNADTERRAILGIKSARLNLLSVIEDPNASWLDVELAGLGVDESKNELSEARATSAADKGVLAEMERVGVEGSERVRDAQERLAGAYRQVEDAQRGINDAQRELVETQQDVAERQREAAEGAVEAQQALAKAQQDAAQGRQDALAGVADAERDLAETQQDVAERQQDAAEGLADAQRDYVRTQQDVVRSNEDSAEAIEDAERGLQDAKDAYTEIKAEAEGVTKETKAYDEALKELGPNARKFVELLIEGREVSKDLKKALQEAVLPGATVALRELLEFVPEVKDELVAIGGAVSDIFANLGKSLFNGDNAEDIQTILSNSVGIIESGGRAIGSFLNGMIDLTVVAAPMAQWVADVFEGWAKTFELWAQSGRDTGSLEKFLEKSKDVLQTLGSIIADYTAGIRDLLAIGADAAGYDLLDSIAENAEKFRAWVNDPGNLKRIQTFFREGAEVLREFSGLIGDVVTGLGNMFIDDVGTDNDPSNQIKKLRDEVLPDLLKLIDTLTEKMGPGLIDLIGEILTFLNDMSENGGGAISGFLTTLSTILGTVNELVDKFPLLGDVIAGALFLGGSRKALSLLGLGGLGRGAGGLIGRLFGGKKAATAAGEAAGTAAGGGFIAKFKGLFPKAGGLAGLAGGGAAAATGGGAAAAAGIPAAPVLAGGGAAATGGIALGPLLLIVAAIAAIAGGIYFLYTRSEEFRKAWDEAWGLIKDAFGEVWEILEPALEDLGDLFGDLAEELGPFIAILVEAFGVGASELIVAWATVVANEIRFGIRVLRRFIAEVKIFVEDFQRGMEVVKGAIKRFGEDWDRGIARIRAGLSKFRADWSRGLAVIRGALDRFRDNWSRGLAVIRGALNRFRENFRAGMQRIRDIATGVARAIRDRFGEWSAAVGRVRDRMRDFANDVRDRFRRLRDTVSGIVGGIRRVLDGMAAGFRNTFSGLGDAVGNVMRRIANAVSGPLDFVINGVINSGLIGGLNRVLGFLGVSAVPTIPFTPRKYAKGGSVLPFASGGGVPGAGNKDTVPAYLTPGEFVFDKESTKHLGTDYLYWLMASAKGYNSGGEVDSNQSPLSKAWSGAKDWAGNRLEGVAEGATDLLAGGAAATFRALTGPLLNGLGRLLPQSRFGSMLEGVSRYAADGFANFLGRKESESASRATATGGDRFGRSGAWPPITPGVVAANTAAAAAFVRNKFGVDNIGTMGQRSNKSDHPLGKALDAMVYKDRAKGDRIASFFTSNPEAFGTKYVIFYDRVNSGGGWKPYTHPSGNTTDPTLRHLDHVHVSFLNKGGAAGRSAPRKPSGRSPLRFAKGGGVGLSGMSRGLSAGLPMPQIVDGGRSVTAVTANSRGGDVNFGGVTIVNPQRESVAVSLPKAMRRINTISKGAQR